MVGRDAEVDRLRAAADMVIDGKASTIVVLGEAGIGKTRLVSEFAAQLRADGWVMCSGHGVELSGGTIPFGVVAETLRALVGDVGVRARACRSGRPDGSAGASCAGARSCWSGRR